MLFSFCKTNLPSQRRQELLCSWKSKRSMQNLQLSRPHTLRSCHRRRNATISLKTSRAMLRQRRCVLCTTQTATSRGRRSRFTQGAAESAGLQPTSSRSSLCPLRRLSEAYPIACRRRRCIDIENITMGTMWSITLRIIPKSTGVTVIGISRIG